VLLPTAAGVWTTPDHSQSEWSGCAQDDRVQAFGISNGWVAGGLFKLGLGLSGVQQPRLCSVAPRLQKHPPTPEFRIYISGFSGGPAMSVPRITADELRKRMETGEDFTIIDVRKPEVWAESDTMISESIRVPLDKLEQNLARIPKGRPVVAYCT
jgi:hypothetical protein